MAHPLLSKPSTVIITLFFLTITLLLLYSILSPLSNPSTKPKPNKNPLPKSHFHDTFLSLASNYTVSSYLKALTLHPHLAGTEQGHNLALYVKSHFDHLRLETHVAEYSVLLSYPVKTSLTINSNNENDGGVVFPSVVNVNDGTDEEVVQPYHAYSPSGTAVGPAVFVNYGRERDYERLREMGVNVSGCVGVVRRGGGVSRGEAVRRAGKEGAVGVIMYTEGGLRKGVERGHVRDGLGDPLSPGWASVGKGGERRKKGESGVEDRFPKIPSLPVSVETAEVVLRSLKGPLVPQEWKDEDQGFKTKLDNVGPGPTVLNFTYKGEEKTATIHDVFAVIRGMEEPDRYVLLGNHRDAWTYGAVDPSSGTAALLDVARRYAFLMRLGWSPRRTIILCSWDAEEFGMIGSTEWVEENIMNLGSKAVAYLNVDCAVQGPGLFPSMTPQLDDLFVEITKKVKDPDVEGTTIFDQCSTNKDFKIQRLSGVDSDFAPFLQHAGVPSVDMYYGKDIPVYHSAFDSYDWMISHGDPHFHRHVAVAGLWGLLGLRLADDPILPFSYSSYALQLQEYTNILENMLAGPVSFRPITASIQRLLKAVKNIEEEAKKLKASSDSSELAVLKKRILNDCLIFAERGLLDADGLLGSHWFKHLVYGPSSGYEDTLNFFPSIANAIAQSKQMYLEGDATIQHEIWRVARAIQRAADALSGDLS